MNRSQAPSAGMRALAGRTVLVTGGALGVGRELVRLAAGARRVLTKVGPPHVLANNAGVVNGALFWEQDPERMEFVVRVNTLAPMLVARAFLPAMLALPEAHLLNMISVGGYATLPRAVVYTASKWGALGWSEGLAQELRSSGIQHVHVTSVFPGPISSGMFEGAKAARVMP